MNLCDILNEGNVLLPLKSKSRGQAVQELLDRLHKMGHLSETVKLHEYIETAEENQSSATGRGIAYPHSKSIEVDGLVCILGISPRGIDFNAPDGQNCHFILLTLVPNEGPVGHRKFINRFRAMIDHGDIRTQFLDAKDASQVLKVISQWETQEAQEEFE
jgi:PTS system fructose-specific IIC component